MKGGFWLSDEQFELIKQHLPYRAAGGGARMTGALSVALFMFCSRVAAGRIVLPNMVHRPRFSIAIIAGHKRATGNICSAN